MKLVKTEEAVGQVLCHDMTQIIPGVSKGPGSEKDILCGRRISRCC